MDWLQIGKWVVAAIAALAAVGFVIKFSINRRSRSTVTTQNVTQSNNRAGGDIVAGNKTENKR